MIKKDIGKGRMISKSPAVVQKLSSSRRRSGKVFLPMHQQCITAQELELEHLLVIMNEKSTDLTREGSILPTQPFKT